MKKLLCFLIMVVILFPSAISASCKTHHNSVHHSNYHSSGSSSNPVYLVNKEMKQEQVKFQDCNEHYAVQETTTNYFSDGSKRVYTNSTVYKTDGTILVSDCSKLEHIIYNGKHYFIVYKK